MKTIHLFYMPKSKITYMPRVLITCATGAQGEQGPQGENGSPRDPARERGLDCSYRKTAYAGMQRVVPLHTLTCMVTPLEDKTFVCCEKIGLLIYNACIRTRIFILQPPSDET